MTTEALTGDAGHDWRTALRERVERAARRRAQRDGLRREAARRRAHGLIDRSAARLARVRAPVVTDGDTG
ncbi:hypothetical protein Ait01nite_022340 [Actinoplanes italicus]|uniref:Uncharacterized protein n=1 Tax=Actinoplanes italicus TaxID=113567 RepID=A0A2T0KNP8_9ACTN|nr:hypothetical protein [Actinoplanes italicus]PRX25371.1 hypothetical protein CLV67_10184 [Actinoplanes italicus]GIE29189.1 hypothetical protein Ait01nite_022340 [Actinoplanes italicus]